MKLVMHLSPFIIQVPCLGGEVFFIKTSSVWNTPRRNVYCSEARQRPFIVNPDCDVTLQYIIAQRSGVYTGNERSAHQMRCPDWVMSEFGCYMGIAFVFWTLKVSFICIYIYIEAYTSHLAHIHGYTIYAEVRFQLGLCCKGWWPALCTSQLLFIETGTDGIFWGNWRRRLFHHGSGFDFTMCKGVLLTTLFYKTKDPLSPGNIVVHWWSLWSEGKEKKPHWTHQLGGLWSPLLIYDFLVGVKILVLPLYLERCFFWEKIYCVLA